MGIERLAEYRTVLYLYLYLRCNGLNRLSLYCPYLICLQCSSRRFLKRFTEVASMTLWGSLFQALMTLWQKNWCSLVGRAMCAFHSDSCVFCRLHDGCESPNVGFTSPWRIYYGTKTGEVVDTRYSLWPVRNRGRAALCVTQRLDNGFLQFIWRQSLDASSTLLSLIVTLSRTWSNPVITKYHYSVFLFERKRLTSVLPATLMGRYM